MTQLTEAARACQELHAWWGQYWSEFARPGCEHEYQRAYPYVGDPGSAGTRMFWFVDDDGSMGEWLPTGTIFYCDQGPPQVYHQQPDGSWKVAALEDRA